MTNAILKQTLTKGELKQLVKEVTNGRLNQASKFVYNYDFHNLLYRSLIKTKQWARARSLLELHSIDSNYYFPEEDFSELLLEDDESCSEYSCSYQEDSEGSIEDVSSSEDEEVLHSDDWDRPPGEW